MNTPKIPVTFDMADLDQVTTIHAALTGILLGSTAATAAAPAPVVVAPMTYAVPAPEAPVAAPAAAEETPKRGRGRPPKATPAPETDPAPVTEAAPQVAESAPQVAEPAPQVDTAALTGDALRAEVLDLGNQVKAKGSVAAVLGVLRAVAPDVLRLSEVPVALLPAVRDAFAAKLADLNRAAA